MKKTLLSLVVIATAFATQAQVTFSGVSPAAVVGNYDFGVQAAEGIWPGEVDDGTWNVTSPDFNINGTFIQDTLMLVEDGTPGLNPQGNPMSQEGCSPLINDLSGKIAVVYRNTCEFGTKVLNAQNAGAIAVILVNREDAVIGMLGGTDGPNVTIPCIAVSSVTGATLINEMANGPVVVFIGNKLGVFANDMGSYKEDIMVAKFGAIRDDQMTGFDLGIQLYNFGANTQSNATVNGQIVGPTGVVYDNTVNLPVLNTGDTAFVFNGNTEEFLPFTMASYPIGDYTLTYTIDLGVADDDSGDNVFVSNFSVTNDLISLAYDDGTGQPTSNIYPKNSTTQYKSCMFYENPGAGNVVVEGVYFTAFSSDLTAVPLAGEEITITIEEWNDVWADMSDPNIFSGLDSLNVVSFEQYYPASDAENGVTQYQVLSTPLPLVNDQRYLVCLETFNSEIAFGYEGNIDYSANQAIYSQPVSPLQIDGSAGQWYSGWSGTSASSIGLKTGYLGLEEITSEIKGKAYPNPAGDNLMISVEAEGAAVLTVTDLSGKVVLAKDVDLVNGLSAVNTSQLEAGMYIFNVTLENGSRSIFNVVKK